jgi:hypothetical protein
MACRQVPPPRRPTRKPFRPLEPRASRRWPQVLAAAAVALLVLAPAALAPRSEKHEQFVAGEAWPTDVNLDPVAARPGEAPRPVPNQKRAPCTAGLETELSGACWLELAKKPPNCPPQAVAYEGRCLLPVAVPRPVPSTVDGGGAATP